MKSPFRREDGTLKSATEPVTIRTDDGTDMLRSCPSCGGVLELTMTPKREAATVEGKIRCASKGCPKESRTVEAPVTAWLAAVSFLAAEELVRHSVVPPRRPVEA